VPGPERLQVVGPNAGARECIPVLCSLRFDQSPVGVAHLASPLDPDPGSSAAHSSATLRGTDRLPVFVLGIFNDHPQFYHVHSIIQ